MIIRDHQKPRVKRKLRPAYGNSLAERQKYQNLPIFVAVCIGKDSWERAKKWNKSLNDVCALRIGNEPPNQHHWPVANCQCVIDWDTGPDEKQSSN